MQYYAHYTHFLNNPVQPNSTFSEQSRPDPTAPEQAEQVQCNIIEQFYVNNIQVTQNAY